jgi:hypothetical protein
VQSEAPANLKVFRNCKFNRSFRSRQGKLRIPRKYARRTAIPINRPSPRVFFNPGSSPHALPRTKCAISRSNFSSITFILEKSPCKYLPSQTLHLRCVHERSECLFQSLSPIVPIFPSCNVPSTCNVVWNKSFHSFHNSTPDVRRTAGQRQGAHHRLSKTPFQRGYVQRHSPS